VVSDKPVETWYRVKLYHNCIEPVEVQRWTAAFVVVNGRRHARATKGTLYEPDFDNAKAQLIAYHELRVSRATSALAVAQADLDQARLLENGKSKPAWRV